MSSQHDRQIARESQRRRAKVLFLGTHAMLVSRARAVAKVSMGDLRDLAGAHTVSQAQYQATEEACARLDELVTLCDDMDAALKQWRKIDTEITYEEIADSTDGLLS